MTKRFCDICGELADNRATDCFTTTTDHGEPWNQSIPIAVVQCKITTTVRFGFMQHPSGFGGPPDLCRGCAAKLIADLLNKI